MLKHISRQLCLFASLLISYSVFAETALWVAESEGLLKVATSTGDILFEIEDANNIDRLAIDQKNSTVWLYAKGELKAYSANGVLQLQQQVSGIKQQHKAIAMEVDENNIWLAIHKRLYQIDHQGNIQNETRFSQTIQSLGLDTKRSQVWVAVKRKVFVLDQDSTEVDHFRTVFPFIPQLAYDAFLDSTWYVAGPFLVRRSNSDLNVEWVSRLGVGFSLWQHLSPDGQGGVWGSTSLSLTHITNEGLVDVIFNPFRDYAYSHRSKHTHRIVDLIADPVDHSVWVANRKIIKHFSEVGALEDEIIPDLGDGVIRGISQLELSTGTESIEPTIEITEPQSNEYVNDNQVPIRFNYVASSNIENDAIEILVNGQAVTATCTIEASQAVCIPDNLLEEGETHLSIIVTDASGMQSDPATVDFIVDTISPSITLEQPQDGLVTNLVDQSIAGQIDETPQTLTLAHNGDLLTLQADTNNKFSAAISLVEGLNQLSISAVDFADNYANSVVTVLLDTQIPAIPDFDHITINPPDEGVVVIQGNTGSVEANALVTISNTKTGQSIVALANTEGAFIAGIFAEDGDQLSITVSDAAQNTSEVSTVEVPRWLPPDPATIATATNPNEITPFADTVAFIYSGEEAIQLGISDGTIETDRVTVIRGKVLERDNQPLSGVTISVLNHPEFGYTLSREDGYFDIAVNGGGLITLEYEKEDYLLAQRKVNTPWQDYSFVEDVVLIQLDPQVSTIDLSSAQTMQVAQGTVQTDSDGSRQATVLFPQGTTATMQMPDGSHQALTTLNVRATEYTVGENGPQTMPGELPALSGYTYAVELSIDEAIAAGAEQVNFNQAIPFYVDNFIGFPTGEAVPVGYYDHKQGAWVASENGRVIEILNIGASSAILDVTGAGVAATQEELDELGISTAELQQLASMYSAGKTVWRSRVSHFSTIDCNWPYRPPGDAQWPLRIPPLWVINDQSDAQSCSVAGCVIDAQRQSLGEKVPIVGTPYSLHYQSERMPGYRSNSSVTIPLSGDSVPDTLRGIAVKIDVAGQRHEYMFPAEPDLTHVFEWDGLDRFGRERYGVADATITIRYIYPCQYFSGGNGFGGGSSSDSVNGMDYTGSRENCLTMGLLQPWNITLESPLMSPVAVVGGWSVNVHHTWIETLSRIHRGDGQLRNDSDGGLANPIHTAAGNGDLEYLGDGGLATDTGFYVSDIVFDPAGNLYIGGSGYVRKVDRDGIITTIAGNGGGGTGNNGDGGPAVDAWLQGVVGLALDAEGNLYIAESSGNCVRKVDTNGIITTIAGGHDLGFSGDAGPATEAQFWTPRGIAVDSSGNLYISDSGNERIRRVDRNGIITTIAGTGVRGFSGDGGPAQLARFYRPEGLAVDQNDNLFIADSFNNRIRRIGSDGIITTVAGSGSGNYYPMGDGIPATTASIRSPRDIALDAWNNLYISDAFHHRIRMVDGEGIINTIAGTGYAGFSGDEGPATRAQIDTPMGIAVNPYGSVYFVDSNNHRVRSFYNSQKIGIVDGEKLTGITSEDGLQRYDFNEAGQHRRTVNTLTDAVELSFAHDEEGRLISITDVDNETTVIERDTEGKPTAIVAPDGQRTVLTANADGYLETITNPANEVYRMSYTTTGLLTEFRDRRNQSNNYRYNELGRLEQDTNAGGGGWTISREDLGNNKYQTRFTSAEGRVSQYMIEPLTDGDLVQVNTASDGSVRRLEQGTNGQDIITQADGTVITVQKGPDPRFGMQAPVPEEIRYVLPSGLNSIASTARSAVLSDQNDPLSPQIITEMTKVNDREFVQVYDEALKTTTYTTAEGRTQIQQINTQGRPTVTQVTGLAAVNYAYDSRGRLETITEGAGVNQRQTTMSYHSTGLQAGYLQSITDAENRTVSFVYDGAGRVTEQILPDNRKIGYGYDANDNLTSITPPGRPAHVFNYNAFDLEGQYTPPTVNGVANPATVYDYNRDKQLELITRPDGQTVDFQYNATTGQLETLVIPTGSYTYTYLPTSGQLDTITSPDSIVLDYSYDGFLLTGQSWSGDISGSVTQTYNNNFFVTQRCVNTSNCINATYDNDGLLTSAGSLSLTRDPQRGGLITNTTLGNANTANTYNSFGELESVDANYQTTDLYDVSYVRDDIGRIETKTETIQGVTSSEVYGYDLAGRLETVTRNGVVTTYGYDSNGNRLNRTTGITGETGVYDNQDRLISYDGFTYTYTDNGELLSKTNSLTSDTTHYEYDVLGNLLSVELPSGDNVEYIIDGQNRRVGKQVNGILTQGFLYQDQLNPVAELNANGSIRSRFVYGTKANIPSYMIRDGITYRLISDHLGSPRLVVNTEDGTIAQRIDYDEFGRVLTDTNPGFQPFGFAGGLYDSQTGLVRFGARDYDPQSGRWTTKDPIRFGGGLNLYGYTFGDPINYVDVTGNAPGWAGWTGAILGAVGFGVAIAGAPVTGLVLIAVGGGLAIWDWSTTPGEQLERANKALDPLREETEKLNRLLDKHYGAEICE